MFHLGPIRVFFVNCLTSKYKNTTHFLCMVQVWEDCPKYAIINSHNRKELANICQKMTKNSQRMSNISSKVSKLSKGKLKLTSKSCLCHYMQDLSSKYYCWSLNLLGTRCSGIATICRFAYLVEWEKNDTTVTATCHHPVYFVKFHSFTLCVYIFVQKIYWWSLTYL